MTYTCGFLYPDDWPDWAEVWERWGYDVPRTYGDGIHGVLCEDDADRLFEADVHLLGRRVADDMEDENEPRRARDWERAFLIGMRFPAHLR